MKHDFTGFTRIYVILEGTGHESVISTSYIQAFMPSSYTMYSCVNTCMCKCINVVTCLNELPELVPFFPVVVGLGYVNETKTNGKYICDI